jgi:protein-tyrosine phosphatase
VLEPHLTEDGSAAEQHPRATAILRPGEFGALAGLWMGGARSMAGEDVPPARLALALLIDTAGEMPPEHLAAALQTRHCVFTDNEEVPSAYPRIRELSMVAAAALTTRGGPGEVFIVCSQGLNRSGLLTGLVLRELGIPGAEAVALIRRQRPGSLANHAYEQLLVAPH